MKPDELRRILEAAGRQDPPPRSVKDLPVLDPSILHRTPQRRSSRVLAVAAAVLVLVAGLFLATRGGDDTDQVATEPSSTTTVAPATTLPPVTTSVATTVRAQDVLTITCATTQEPRPMVTCEWSATTRPGLDHYRLWKHTDDGPDREVAADTAARAVDTAVVVGARLVYEVAALAADGTVLGHGVTMVTCC
jgi:hypothetical protein